MTTAKPEIHSDNSLPSKEESNSFRSKLLGSSSWVFLGHGLSQAIRLGGNLILTRILFPEAFGLMALISVLIMGVAAFSDIGIKGSIVHNPRGNEDVFLNTAWTIQIARSCLVWFVLCLFAKPIALFYEAPELVYLIPVVGFSAVLQGCASTSILTLVREISLRRNVLVELGGQIAGLIIMVIAAWFWRSVWALAIGSLFAATFKTVWSHFLIPNYRNRLAFDREAAKEILHFGKWIFVATALTFLGGQGDRLVLGKVFDTNTLGIYSIAFFLSQAIFFACHQLSMNVLFPVFAQLRKRDIAEVRNKITKIRGGLLALTLPPICVLAIWGPQIVDFFYDDRYIEAGWMLQILSVRAIAQTVMVTTERVLMAYGDSFRHMISQLFRAFFMVIGMSVGYFLAEIQGFLIGMAIGSFCEYFVLAVLINRYKVWLPKIDMLAFGLSGGVILLGRYLT